MVVDDLNVVRVAAAPSETDPPLVVDSDAVLPAPVALERLQPVARRYAQVVQALGGVELNQLA